MTEALDDMRAAAVAAFDKIGHDPNRINELEDADFMAIARDVTETLPIAHATFLKACGDDATEANRIAERLKRYPQGKLVKLVRRAVDKVRRLGEPSKLECGAIWLDCYAGVNAVNVEAQRRNAHRSGQIN